MTLLGCGHSAVIVVGGSLSRLGSDLQWQSQEYVVTNRRVIQVEGV